MPIWQWIGASSFAKEIQVSDALPTSADDYPEREYYDTKASTRELTFGCDGMTATEYEALGAALGERGLLVSVQDHVGVTWTGKFRSLTGTPIPGCHYVESIQLTLEG